MRFKKGNRLFSVLLVCSMFLGMPLCARAEGPETTEITETDNTDNTDNTNNTDDSPILNRPDQSKEVETTVGNPDQTKNEDPDVVLPTGYEVLLGEDGIFRVTYTIAEDCDAEHVYIDLNQAMEIAKKYCAMTDSTWVEPGDTRIVQVYIRSLSGHTYKYSDGSFVLTTADLGTNQTQKDEDGKPVIEEPKEEDVVGFDQQVLPKKDQGKDKFNLSITSPSVEELFVQLGFFTQNEADYNLQSANLDYSQYAELKKYLKENYGTDNVSEGMQKYLLEYYSTKDNKDYADFNAMMKESSSANDDLYTGTQANKLITIKSASITNQTVANKLIGSSDAYMSVRFPALQNLINDKLGTTYNFTGTSSQNWTELKNALIADGHQNIADLIPTSYSNSSYVPKYLAIYNLLNKSDDAAGKAYLTAMGYDEKDFTITGDVSTSGAAALKTNPDVVPVNVTCPLDPATRYDNFYNTLFSVLVAGSQEEVDAVTGGQSGIVQTVKKNVYKVVDADDGQVYEGCVPASEVGPDCVKQMSSMGLPANTLVQVTSTGHIYFGFGTKDGQIATADHYDGEVSEVYESKMPEYGNDDWSTSDRAPQLADYMNKNNVAWKNANNLFNQLLGEGISAESAAVTAFMAYNLDGPLTGNGYQDTGWSWNSSIKLERIDGEANIKKVDEEGNVIADSETGFALWQFKDEKADDGSTVSKKYYLQQKTEDGNVVYSWVEAKDDNMSITIKTKNGLMDIDYKLLENMVYYLQETVAPEGYQLDPKVFVICDEDDYEAACNKLDEGAKTAYAGAIDSEKPLEIKVVNPKLINIPVRKVWDDSRNQDGIRPASVTVELLADGKVIDSPLVLGEENQWTDIFKDLPKYNDDGEEIVYTIQEQEVTDYTTVIEGDVESGFTITNSHEPELIRIPVKKVWNDSDNKDGVRPESVTVELLADGEVVRTVVLSEENQWTDTFADLPKYKAGQEIVYTVREKDVMDYSAAVEGDVKNGYIITNSHEPKPTPTPTPTPTPNEPSSGTGIGNGRGYGFALLTSMIGAAVIAVRRKEN